MEEANFSAALDVLRDQIQETLDAHLGEETTWSLGFMSSFKQDQQAQGNIGYGNPKAKMLMIADFIHDQAIKSDTYPDSIEFETITVAALLKSTLEACKKHDPNYLNLPKDEQRQLFASMSAIILSKGSNVADRLKELLDNLMEAKAKAES